MELKFPILWFLSVIIWILLNWYFISKTVSLYFSVNYILLIVVFSLAVQEVFKLLGLDLDLWLIILSFINEISFKLIRNFVFFMVILILAFMLIIDLKFLFYKEKEKEKVNILYFFKYPFIKEKDREFKYFLLLFFWLLSLVIRGSIIISFIITLDRFPEFFPLGQNPFFEKPLTKSFYFYLKNEASHFINPNVKVYDSNRGPILVLGKNVYIFNDWFYYLKSNFKKYKEKKEFVKIVCNSLYLSSNFRRYFINLAERSFNSLYKGYHQRKIDEIPIFAFAKISYPKDILSNFNLEPIKTEDWYKYKQKLEIFCNKVEYSKRNSSDTLPPPWIVIRKI